MRAYHEERAAALSEKKIRIFENIVEEPCVMVEDHWHDSFEILYVRSGSGEQYINGQKFSFTRRSLIVICPGDVHSTVAHSHGCEIDVLQFEKEYLSEREELIIDLVSFVTDTPEREIPALLENIRKYAPNDTASAELVISGSLFMLCGMILQHRKTSTSIVKASAFASEVCNYVRNNDNIRLDVVCRHFGYSPEHFSRKFHSDSGISYKHYCEKFKMRKFLQALEDGSISLSEIAERLDYSDTSSFIRAFKRIYGMTPGVYRKLRNSFS